MAVFLRGFTAFVFGVLCVLGAMLYLDGRSTVPMKSWEQRTHRFFARLATYQSLVSVAVAFMAAGGALYATTLSYRGVRETIEAQDRRTRNEVLMRRVSLANALLAEVRMLIEATTEFDWKFQANLKMLKDDSTYRFRIPLPFTTDVYKANVSNIGGLPLDVAQEVVKIYSVFEVYKPYMLREFTGEYAAVEARFEQMKVNISGEFRGRAQAAERLLHQFVRDHASVAM